MSRPTNAPALPQDLDAERAALGSMCLDGEARRKVASMLTADAFVGAGHRAIFGALVALESEGQPADLITVRDRLERDGFLSDAGGIEGIVELAEAVPSAANAEYYARIVLRLHYRRQLLLRADRLRELVGCNGDGIAAAAEVAADIAELVRLADASHDSQRRIRLWTAEELMEEPAPAFVVDDVIPASGFVLVYGPPKASKSFLCLDIALAVASGLPEWRGHTITPAPVLYLAMEGGAGLAKRLRAWTGDAGKIPDGIRFVRQCVGLRSPSEADTLIAELGGFRPGLTVIDTVARAIPGADENASRDMGSFVAAVDHLRGQLGTAVVAVHHTGKTSESGERGSSCLRGAVDVRIRVNRAGKRGIEVICEDARDIEGFPPIRLERQTVPVGDSTSCILVTPIPTHGVLSDSERHAYTVLEKLQVTTTRPTWSKWRAAAGLPNSSFANAIHALISGGFVEKADEAGRASYRTTVRALT